MVLRFLLGAFESIVSPGFSLVTGLWWKPSEHACLSKINHLDEGILYLHEFNPGVLQRAL
jgi:hypothetical protein